MPSIQETLRSVLGDDAAVAALVGDRIYPGELPNDETPAPWILYTVPESVPFDTLDDDGDVQHQVEFHALSDSYAEAVAIIEAIKSVLNAYTGGQIRRAFWQSTAEEETEAGFHHAARFAIWGTSATLVALPGSTARILTSGNTITLEACSHTLTLGCSGLSLDGEPVGSGSVAGNLDGGHPDTNYGGTAAFDGGTP